MGIILPFKINRDVVIKFLCDYEAVSSVQSHMLGRGQCGGWNPRKFCSKAEVS